jgi:hypothetical protein
MIEKEKEKKEPSVKTFEDKGTKLDFVDLGEGRQAFLYREEKFRGLQVWGVRLGWSEKYKLISPNEITMGTFTALSKMASKASGSAINANDFEVVKQNDSNT